MMAKEIWFDRFNKKPLYVGTDYALVLNHEDPDEERWELLKRGWRSSVSFDETAFENVLKSLYEKDTPGIK